ncbi:MAG: glycosyltransferase family 4 protein [Acetobacteraceae bacterium]
MKVLVWQWGRFGAGPRFAAMLADGLRSVPGVTASLSLSSHADVLTGTAPPATELTVDTYRGLPGLIGRAASAPLMACRLTRRIRALAPDLAICAMPGPLDLVMACALRRAGVPFLVIVHDADPHPGDGFPFLMTLQRWLCRTADGVVALTGFIATRLQQQGLAGPDRARLIQSSIPPMRFGQPVPRDAGGPLRLLFFGRLLSYKGLDLLDEVAARLERRTDIQLRVAGSGPDSPELARLSARPGVSVENRWVSEQEVGELMAWADALILPYREASQSGVAAVGLAAGCAIVATDVGGLREQLGDLPGVTLCPPDAERLAAEVIRLAADPAAAKQVRIDVEGAWRDMAAALLRDAEGLPRRR